MGNNKQNTAEMVDLQRENEDLKQVVYGLRLTLKAVETSLNAGDFTAAVDMLQVTLNKLGDGEK